MSATTPPTESGRLLESAEKKFCYYPPPTEPGRLLETAENILLLPPPQLVVVPLLDYPLWIRPCSLGTISAIGCIENLVQTSTCLINYH